MPAELYFIDRLNPKEHIQGIVFVGVAVYISLGVANNVLYTLVQYLLRAILVKTTETSAIRVS